jgi:MFS family permease
MFAVAWGANQFVPMLVAYKAQRGVSVSLNDALFGIYALSLIVSLLLCGPAADIWGRARLVRPAVALAAVSSVLLMLGDHSVALLFAGRFTTGVASGAVFAAGTAWVRELSAGHAADAGPRRAALALSAGFGLGPVATGLVAQWAPHPLVLAYVPHLVLSLVALPLVFRTPETVRPAGPDASGYLARLRVPSVSHRRFRTVVLPAAPWVFAAPALAFAVQPSLVSDRVHGYAIVYSGLVAAVALGVGIAVQPLARRLDARDDGVGASVTGLSLIVVGALLAALAVSRTNPWLALVAAAPLGAGYGLDLVGGLAETQRIAGPDELAGLTGVYFSLTYIGFALPLVLAEAHPVASYPTMIVVVAVLVALTAAGVAAASRAISVRR